MAGVKFILKVPKKSIKIANNIVVVGATFPEDKDIDNTEGMDTKQKHLFYMNKALTFLIQNKHIDIHLPPQKSFKNSKTSKIKGIGLLDEVGLMRFGEDVIDIIKSIPPLSQNGKNMTVNLPLDYTRINTAYRAVIPQFYNVSTVIPVLNELGQIQYIDITTHEVMGKFVQNKKVKETVTQRQAEVPVPLALL
ncbi:hypothetical protein EIN_114950 [Entamoeba invadens IP1]|uniref:Uncharacterized protein n=1 Tax=Entamoeba invadens IP1 TaxID=370355 RepID=A0A0A1U199_ENTIV|nr:hypothetical protein EIN_114950 [Entamoeba invadens IP1]ELP86291.1 hypothetical protein EIN_114950 [Entamoeba invadens IP1]|eukprot:XP_004185637.1 hypothetical protein EIN_114950 [Entamoeba invadens IP1]